MIYTPFRIDSIHNIIHVTRFMLDLVKFWKILTFLLIHGITCRYTQYSIQLICQIRMGTKVILVEFWKYSHFWGWITPLRLQLTRRIGTHNITTGSTVVPTVTIGRTPTTIVTRVCITTTITTQTYHLTTIHRHLKTHHIHILYNLLIIVQLHHHLVYLLRNIQVRVICYRLKLYLSKVRFFSQIYIVGIFYIIWYLNLNLNPNLNLNLIT